MSKILVNKVSSAFLQILERAANKQGGDPEDRGGSCTVGKC